jgi:hypothetical protein
MSYNGSGVFIINSSGQPVITGTTITSTAFNALTADLAVGLTTCITKDGQTTTTAAIPFGTLGILTDKVNESTATAGVAVKGTSVNPIANAAAGYVGEYITSTVLVGSAVSLTTATEANITSISLTAGDWDVEGCVVIAPAGGTSLGRIDAWTSSTSATLPTAPNNGGYAKLVTTFTASNQALSVGRQRFNLAATTTVYLSCYTAFSASTCTAYGFISARRVR